MAAEKILIVDDNDLMRTLLRGILRHEDYEVVGEDAITVPAGTFDAFEVQSDGQGSVWYARGIGWVLNGAAMELVSID